jgi:nucleoside-diphosphate-sugar epimerase
MDTMRSSFWKNQSVFVTGHTGFKGSWLCLWPQLVGARVTGYAQRPPGNMGLVTGFFGVPRESTAASEALVTERLSCASEALTLVGMLG